MRRSSTDIGATPLLAADGRAAPDAFTLDSRCMPILHGGAQLALGEYTWPENLRSGAQALFWLAFEDVAARRVSQLYTACAPYFADAFRRVDEQVRPSMRRWFPDIEDLPMLRNPFVDEYPGDHPAHRAWIPYRCASLAALIDYFRDECPPVRAWATENRVTDPWCLEYIVVQVCTWCAEGHGDPESSGPPDRLSFTDHLPLLLTFPLTNLLDPPPVQLGEYPAWEPTLEKFGAYEDRVLTQVRAQLSHHRRVMAGHAADFGHQKVPVKMAREHFAWLVSFQVLGLRRNIIAEQARPGTYAPETISRGIKAAARAIDLRSLRVEKQGAPRGPRAICRR